MRARHNVVDLAASSQNVDGFELDSAGGGGFGGGLGLVESFGGGLGGLLFFAGKLLGGGQVVVGFFG